MRSHLVCSKIAERVWDRIGSSAMTLETTAPPWLDTTGVLEFSKKLVSRLIEAAVVWASVDFDVEVVTAGADLSPNIHTSCWKVKTNLKQGKIARWEAANCRQKFVDKITRLLNYHREHRLSNLPMINKDFQWLLSGSFKSYKRQVFENPHIRISSSTMTSNSMRILSKDLLKK